MLGMFDFTKVSNPKPVVAASPVSAAGKAACIKLHPHAAPASLGNI